MAISFDNVKGWLVRGGGGDAADVQWVVRKGDGKLLWGKPVEYVANTSTTLLMPAGKYRIVLIGAGGGGAWSDTGKHNDGYQKATGGGGAGVKGILTLSKNSRVTIVVGSAGTSSGPSNYHYDGSYTGSPGGDTFISIDGNNVVVAGGGAGGHAHDVIGMEHWGGGGGTYTCDAVYMSEFSDSVNGNNGNSVGKWNSIPSDVAYASGPFSEYEYGFSGGNAKKVGNYWVEASRASDGAAFITTW